MANLLNTIAQHRHRKKITITAISFIVIIVMLPLVIQWGIIYALKEQGAKSAEIEDIDLNLFNGTFKLNQLSAQFNDAAPLRIQHVFVDLNIIDLFSSKIVLEQVNIDGVHVNVHKQDNGDISINGFIPPAAEKSDANTEDDKESKPIDFAIKSLVLKQSSASYNESEFSQHLRIDSVSLSELNSWQHDNFAALNFQLFEQQTSINGQLDLNLFASEMQIKGQIAVNQLQPTAYQKFYQAHLQQLDAKLNLQADIDLKLSPSFAASGSVKHQIKVEQLALNYQQLQQKIALINWQGLVHLDNNIPSAQGQLSIQQSQLSDLETQTVLNTFETLELTDFNYTTDLISFKQFGLDKVALLQDAEQIQLLTLERIAVNQLQFSLSEFSLNIHQVDIQSPNIYAALSEQQQLTHLALLNPTLQRLQTPTKKQDVNKSDAPQKPLSIQIAEINLSQPGKVDFADFSVQPNYATTLQLEKLDIKQLSSSQEAQFNAHIKQGEYNTFDISGTGTLLAPTEQLNVKTVITQLDLPPISAYSSKSIGYSIKSGVVNSTIDAKIAKKQLDAHIKLDIDSIDIVEVDKESAEQLSSASGMSIGLALNTLKDSDNKIDLELPVKGDINDPNFDLSLVVNKALGIAMKSASISYLKHAIQPFGSLITLFSIVEGVANNISLAPVVFDTNQSELPENQGDLLNKVTVLLNDRPNIKIKACAINSASDKTFIIEQLTEQKKADILAQYNALQLKQDDIIQAIDAQVKAIAIGDDEITKNMLSLADQRSANIKNYFIKKQNIPPSRILNCLSNEDLSDESKPRVELII